jgi:Fur family transcriptional regulator, ferric uptake regulator
MSATEKILKNHQLKVTTTRSEIIDIFSNAGCAVSSQDIEATLTQIDRITLYRNLKVFEDKGIIHKVLDGTMTQKYALCDDSCDEHSHKDEHVHFHCQECKSTFCMDHIFVPTITLPTGFQFDNAHMVVNGRCQKCVGK